MENIRCHLDNYEVQVSSDNFEFELDCWLTLDAQYDSEDVDKVDSECIERLHTIIRRANNRISYDINPNIIPDPSAPRSGNFIESEEVYDHYMPATHADKQSYIDELIRRIQHAFSCERSSAAKVRLQANNTSEQVKRRKS